MKLSEMRTELVRRGWRASTTILKSNDGNRTARLFHPPQDDRDPILLYEADGEVTVYRASIRSLDMVISGKAPPA